MIMENKGYFHTRFSYDSKRQVIWRCICGYLQRYIPPDSRVLDIGAGYCSFINNIKAKEKIALDISDIPRKHAAKEVLFCQDSACCIKEISASSVDVVFASNLLEHLSGEDVELVLSQVGRVLKKNGIFIIIQPNFRYSYKVYFEDYTHKQVFTDKSLSDLLEKNGFGIIRVIPQFMPFSMKSKMPKLGFLVWLYLRLPFKPFGGQMCIVAKKP